MASPIVNSKTWPVIRLKRPMDTRTNRTAPVRMVAAKSARTDQETQRFFTIGVLMVDISVNGPPAQKVPAGPEGPMVATRPERSHQPGRRGHEAGAAGMTEFAVVDI